MLGRGLVARPQLITELVEYEKCLAEGREWKECSIDMPNLKRYHDRLLAQYMEQMLGDGNNVLFKMKECWGFMERHFPEQEKIIKKLKKAGKLSEYEALAETFFEQPMELFLVKGI